MRRVQEQALLGAMAFLMVLLVVEWLPGETPVPPPAAPARVASGPQTAARLAARDTEAWVSTILARPLFSVSRKPPKAAAAKASASGPGMPRLSGIMIFAGVKRAIFAPEGGGKPLVLEEGASLDDTSIRTIQPGQVILASGEVLRPAYDKNRVPGTPAFVPPDLPRPGFAPGGPGFNPAFNPGFNPAFPGGANPAVQQPGAAADLNDTAPAPGPPPFRGLPQRRE